MLRAYYLAATIAITSFSSSAITIGRNSVSLNLPIDLNNKSTITISRNVTWVEANIYGYWNKTEPIKVHCKRKNTTVNIHLMNFYVYRHGPSKPTPKGIIFSNSCSKLSINGKVMIDENTITSTY